MNFFHFKKKTTFQKELKNILGFYPNQISLFKTALTHRSLQDKSSLNNERLEFLGDAVLSAYVADYLFKKYPYKEEGFLTEMRSKMVNRQQLNSVALKMGIKQVAKINKSEYSMSVTQLYGNMLEAIIGALYLEKGYIKTCKWIHLNIIQTHLFIDHLEVLEINHKNKLYGWANKNCKTLSFDTVNEEKENGRRIFTVAVVLGGKEVSRARSFTKKEASQLAAKLSVEKLGIQNSDTDLSTFNFIESTEEL